MNRGLKNYTKQLTQTVGNAGTVSVNINKNDANMHIVLPVLKTIGLAPIDLKLIYNYQDRNVDGLFGKGFKLNFYSKLTSSGNSYTMLNADGSRDTYVEGQTNKETQLVIRGQSDGYDNMLGYQIMDRQGNIIEYSTEQTEYPKLIKTATDSFTLDFIKNYPTIENGRGDLVRFITSGNKVEKVVYSRSEAAILIVELVYDSNNRLISLVYTDGTGRTSKEYALNSTSVIYGTDTVTLKDNISTKCVKVTFNSIGEATTVEEGYGNIFLSERKITVSYANNKATVTNAKNNSVFYYFDSNGLPLCQIDSQGVAIETEFDSTTKRLLAKSAPILVNCPDTIYSGKASYFSKSGVTVADKSCSDEILKKFIGTTSTVKGSGTLTCEIPYSGIPGDNIMAVIWGKQLKSLSQGKVTVSLNVGNETDVDFFKKDVADSYYDFLTLGITANKTFSKIVMQIQLENNAEIEICGIHILKKKYGTVYKYDDYGNCTEVENSGKTMALRYNEKSLLTNIISADSSYAENEYNTKNKVERSITAFGTTITNVYDDFNHLVKTTMQTADNSRIIETARTYTFDGRFMESVTDEMGKTTKFTHDNYGRIIKVLDAMGCVSESNYEDNGLLKKLILGTGNVSQSATYNYDQYRLIKSIILSGERVYDFVYDDKNNLADILLNDTVLYQFEYDELGNVIAEKYGLNSGKMLFEYNKFGNIVKVKYLAINSKTPQLKYQYEYDALQLLTRVLDGKGNEIVRYAYDHDGNRISEVINDSKIDNIYDVKGNVIAQSRKRGGKSIYQSFERADRSKSECPQSLTEGFGQENYLCLFEGHAVLTKGNETIIPKVTDERILDIRRDGFLPFIDTWSSQLSYTFNKSFSNKGFSVQFWFKPEDLYRAGHLFYCQSSSGRIIQVYYQSQKLVLFLDGSEIKTTNQVNEGWNFMSLNVVNESGRHRYCLILNGQAVFNDSFSAFDFGSNPRFFIGSTPKNTYNFRGEIACMMISIGKTMPQKEIQDFYRTSKDYVIEKSAADYNCIDFSETILYTVNNAIIKNYEIFPLHNDYVSLKGMKPILAEKNLGSQLDKDRSFHFNLSSYGYAYVADGCPLVYRLDHTNEGTIMMRAYISQNVGKQYFFEGKDSAGSTLGLYKDSNGKVCVALKETIIHTGLTFAEKEWHTIGLAFGTEVTSTSLSTTSTRKIRVYLDNEVYETATRKSLDFTGLSYSIGRTMDKIGDDNSLTGGECYPLYGQIEMLIADGNYHTVSSTQYVATQLDNISCVTARDEFGMLKRKIVEKRNKGILSKFITYKKRSKNSKYYSNIVDSEGIWIGNKQTKRSYVTDDMGRIKSITDATFGGHTYEYDSIGRVIKDDSKSIFYDKDGNITNLCGVGMEYNNQMRNLITRADGYKVRYDGYDCNLITGWKSKYFEYFRNQLIEFGTGSAQYKYAYNHLGQRISKVGPNGTTQYVYSGLKLVTEIAQSYQLDFLYDENDELYGFVKDYYDYYFYVKDVLGNILGVVDEDGTVVAKYSYAAYGKTTITLNQSSIANINPFRFKCCYQDDESGMYCINGRYYIPEWGRWLTLDKSSIDFLTVGKHDPYGLNTLSPVMSELKTDIPAYTVPKNDFNVVRTERQAAPSFYFSPTNGLVQVECVTVHAAYARGGLGLSLSGDNSGMGLSFASLEIGAADVDFNIPFGETNCGLIINLGACKAEASVGLGISARATLIDGEFGLKFGDSMIKFGAYAGVGIDIGITNEGAIFGMGFGPGFYIALEF